MAACGAVGKVSGNEQSKTEKKACEDENDEKIYGDDVCSSNDNESSDCMWK